MALRARCDSAGRGRVVHGCWLRLQESPHNRKKSQKSKNPAKGDTKESESSQSTDSDAKEDEDAAPTRDGVSAMDVDGVTAMKVESGAEAESTAEAMDVDDDDDLVPLHSKKTTTVTRRASTASSTCSVFSQTSAPPREAWAVEERYLQIDDDHPGRIKVGSVFL